MNLEGLLSKVVRHVRSPQEVWDLLTDADTQKRTLLTIKNLLIPGSKSNLEVFSRFKKESEMLGAWDGFNLFPELPFEMSSCEFSSGSESVETGIVLKWNFPQNVQPWTRLRPLSSPAGTDEYFYDENIKYVNRKLQHMQRPNRGMIIAGFTSEGDILNNGIKVRRKEGIEGRAIPPYKGGIGFNFDDGRMNILNPDEMMAMDGYDVRIGAPLMFETDDLPQDDYNLLQRAIGISEDNAYTKSDNITFMFLSHNQDGSFSANLAITSSDLSKGISSASGMKVSTLQASIYNCLKGARDGQRYVSCEESAVAYPRGYTNEDMPFMQYPMEMVFPLVN